MAVTGTSVVRMTADGDTHDTGNKRLKIKGIRLAVGTANMQAKLREGDVTGPILYALSALANDSAESQIPVNVDSGKLYLELSGTAAEVYVYLD